MNTKSTGRWPCRQWHVTWGEVIVQTMACHMGGGGDRADNDMPHGGGGHRADNDMPHGGGDDSADNDMPHGGGGHRADNDMPHGGRSSCRQWHATWGGGGHRADNDMPHGGGGHRADNDMPHGGGVIVQTMTRHMGGGRSSCRQWHATWGGEVIVQTMTCNMGGGGHRADNGMPHGGEVIVQTMTCHMGGGVIGQTMNCYMGGGGWSCRQWHATWGGGSCRQWHVTPGAVRWPWDAILRYSNDMKLCIYMGAYNEIFLDTCKCTQRVMLIIMVIYWCPCKFTQQATGRWPGGYIVRYYTEIMEQRASKHGVDACSLFMATLWAPD